MTNGRENKSNMMKNKKNEDKKNDEKISKEMNEKVTNIDENEENVEVEGNKANVADKVSSLKVELDVKTKKCDEYYNMLQRTVAEFDNYKKRTAKEKETIYQDALSDAVLAMLPVVDNFERAVKTTESGADMASFKEGMDLVYRQLKDSLKSLGVEEIVSVGDKFDPQLHNAIRHIEDEAHDENTVIEEFQKGYKIQDKVIRHSMVIVAN